MKVLLLTPPYHSGVVESAGTWHNQAYVYLAGSLRTHGHEPVVYDAMSRNDDHAAIIKVIAEVKPDLVGVTAVTAYMPDAVEICRNAKQVNPGIITVLGNVHPTFMWEEIFREHGEAVDYVVRGEGELTLAELADCLAAGGNPAAVAGIVYQSEGRAMATPARPLAARLDDLPRAWDLVEWPRYTYRPTPGSTLAVVSSSRGCNQECTFCSQQLFWNRSWRAMSAERFVDELEELQRRFGVNVAMISDETPTLDRDRWERILGLLIERKLGLELLMETRVDDILRDEDILDRYRAAGISHIYVGVEAADQDTLDTYKKATSVERSRRAIALINAQDIVSETSFLLGLPEETPERIRATVELAGHYAPDLAFFLAVTPWPYSDLYPTLKDYIEVFDYRRYNLTEPVVKPRAMTRDQVTQAMALAHRDFYGNKLQNLNRLSAYKKDFMLTVMRLLMHHSYLAADMQQMGAEMPDWVKKALAG